MAANIPLNVNDLRTILAEEIQKVRDGLTTAANVNAVTNATGKYLSTIKLQMDYCRMTGKTPEIEVLANPISEPQKKIEEKKKI